MSSRRFLLTTTALVVLSSLTACGSYQHQTSAHYATSHAEEYTAAIIEPKMVRTVIKMEESLNARKGVVKPADQAAFEYIPGNQPIIITAPHSVRPFRNGKYRYSDGGGTAAYAAALAELTGAHVLYASYEDGFDANYEDDNAFKFKLNDLINEVNPSLVLDIHGSNPMRSYDLDIGTMNGESLLTQTELMSDLIHRLAKEGILNISVDRFSASKQQTITKFASKRNVPSLQLEINATYLMPSEGSLEAQRFAIMLQGLTRFINQSVLDKEGSAN